MNFDKESGVLVGEAWFARSATYIQKTSAQVAQDASCGPSLIPHIQNIDPLADVTGSFPVLNALLTSLINTLKA